LPDRRIGGRWLDPLRWAARTCGQGPTEQAVQLFGRDKGLGKVHDRRHAVSTNSIFVAIDFY
jgi:hypothetical protein